MLLRSRNGHFVLWICLIVSVIQPWCSMQAAFSRRIVATNICTALTVKEVSLLRPTTKFSFTRFSSAAIMDAVVVPTRRSIRLQKLQASSAKEFEDKRLLSEEGLLNKVSVLKPPKRQKKAQIESLDEEPSSQEDLPNCLLRTRENQLMSKIASLRHVIGVDEAGRGPLAGPVVAAAAIVPTNIDGIVDSKKVTKEEVREELYENIVASPNVCWAAAVVDAAKIDEINILQATLLAMRMAAETLVSQKSENCVGAASVDLQGCYVVRGGPLSSRRTELDRGSVYALVDGNRVPTNMPCDSEFVVKGDSKEFSIAAASIIAKVTRDRLMHGYDKLYPEYNLQQHKGYPTRDHMAAVFEHGASPIHRRSFAPLKHMSFDENGKVVNDLEEESSAK